MINGPDILNYVGFMDYGVSVGGVADVAGGVAGAVGGVADVGAGNIGGFLSDGETTTDLPVLTSPSPSSSPASSPPSSASSSTIYLLKILFCKLFIISDTVI